ncbi:MAG: NAD(P)H-hydrate dehydratase [Pseudomonadota bacterium]|nr:NAD(P)H-hydrate dehydratase [Pseudomonadota bacterium]
MSSISCSELLTVEQMRAADNAATASGVSGYQLMDAAGAAVAMEIQNRWASRPVTVLCGPGNNGGDGFVVARHLAEGGWDVTVALLGGLENISGQDARLHARKWSGDIKPLSAETLEGASLVVDAVFGAGLTRSVDGTVSEVLNRVTERGIPLVAVDIPSGVHGDTGMVLGAASSAQLTVTFFRRKPGHLLLPGRARCGETVVADIGIPADVYRPMSPKTYVNCPDIWLASFPVPRMEDHKYTRGHALIAGGSVMTGAGRLAAAAARRVGTGLVTVASSPDVLHTYSRDAPGLLTLPFGTAGEFNDILEDARKNAVLIGPGAGVNGITRDLVLAAAARERRLVIDADGLTSFADKSQSLFTAIAGIPCVLTPHEGEFSRLFRMTGDKLSRARKAAAVSGAVVLLKGADTVIAAPDGRAAINENAPATLGVAGAGDVLAGTIVGLMAQGMPAFDAACAATWLNGDVANRFGPGLIPEDLPDGIPESLAGLLRY